MAPSKKRGRNSSIAAAAAAAQEWNVGDLVLAKVKGFPPWPAQVSKPEAFGQDHNPSRVFVVFFGTKQIRFCHHSEISRFTPEVRATLIAKAHSKCTPADLRLAVSEICEVAEQKVNLKDGYNDSVVPGLNGRNKVEFNELVENAEAEPVNSEEVSGQDDDQEDDADQPINSYKNHKYTDTVLVDMDLGVKAHCDEAGNGVTSEIDDFDWCSPVSSSSLDGNSEDETHQASKGIVVENVQTNFASHEELDSFDNFDFYAEEDVNVATSEIDKAEKSGRNEKAAISRNWPKTSSRTPAKSKKPAANFTPTIPVNICRKKRRQPTVKAPIAQAVQKNDMAHEAPPVQDTQEFTYRRKVTLKKRMRSGNFIETDLVQKEEAEKTEKADTCSEASPVSHDPDSNLPIVKRARARAAKEAMFDKERCQEEKRLPTPVSTPVVLDTPANGMESGKLLQDEAEPKPKVEEKYSVLKVEGSLPPKAEKYRMRSSLVDCEAALPPSKRLHRALEAMDACVAEAAKNSAEAEEEEVSEDAKADKTVDVIVEKCNIDVEPSPAPESTEDVDKAVVKTCVSDDGLVSCKDFVDKEVDPISVGLGTEEPPDADSREAVPSVNVQDEDHEEQDVKSPKEAEESIAHLCTVDIKEEAIQQEAAQAADEAAEVAQAAQASEAAEAAEAKPEIEAALADVTPTAVEGDNVQEKSISPAAIDEVRPDADAEQGSGEPVAAWRPNGTSSIPMTPPTLSPPVAQSQHWMEPERVSRRIGHIESRPSLELDADHLSLLSSSSRFHADSEVNEVRKAYEAAKELKQKLASKDGDSSSMKYLAAVQSKHIQSIPGSMLFSTDVRSSPSMDADTSKPFSEAVNGGGKDAPLLPGGNKDVSNSGHKSEAGLSAEAEAARDVFEGLLDVLSRAKESILRATRQAVDCAKLGLSEQVIDIIAKRLEMEQSFSRRIDIFFLVDSITQSSHGLKGTPAGVYRSIVQNALPRLLSAAAPPGDFARENRRQCLKVFKLWHERGVFPPGVIRHFMHEIELHNCDRMVMNMSRRPARNERPVDDPIREMEGMQVDEYGSNASFSLPGLSIPHVFEEEEEVNESGKGEDSTAKEGEPAASATPHGPVERHPRVLEDVDGELEMEDVSPEIDTWSRQYVSPASILSGPPLPVCPPPTPPPLPASPPPSTPPPPPPSSPPSPQDAYQDGFSPGYHQHVQNSSMQPPYNRPCEPYEQYDDMRMDPAYSSYGVPGGFSDMPPGPLSPQYGGHHYGHSYQADYAYQPYGAPPAHPSEVGPWSEPSPRSRYPMHDDPYYNQHQEPYHDRYVEHPPDYYHQNGPPPPAYMNHYESGYSSGGHYQSSGYLSPPPPDHGMHMGPGPGRGRRMHGGTGHYSYDGYPHDGAAYSHESGYPHEGGGGYSHGPYPSW